MSSLQSDFLSSRIERSNTFTDGNTFGSLSSYSLTSDSPLSSVKEYNFLSDSHPQNRRPSVVSPSMSPITPLSPHASDQIYSTLSSCDLMQDYDNMKSIETGIETVLNSVERYLQAFRELRKASKDIDTEMAKFYGHEGKLGPIASKLHEFKDPLHDDEVYQELEHLAEAQQQARKDYGHILGAFKHRIDERDSLMAKYSELRAKQRKKKKTPASSTSTTPANSQPGTLKDDLFQLRSSIADLNVALVEDIAIFNEQRQDPMDRCFIQMLTFKSKLHSYFPVDSDIESLIKESKKLSSLTFNDESITDLKQLLSSPLLTYYRNFLTCEHSEENLDFYLDTLSYKSLSLQLEINEQASYIYNTYLRSGAPRQVNIAHNTQQLLDLRMNKPGDFDLNVFDRASKEIYKLMESDSWKRFIKSDFYPRMHYRATRKEWNTQGEETEFKTGGVFPKLSEKKPKTREEYLKIRNKEHKNNGTLKKGILSYILPEDDQQNSTLRKYTLDESSSSIHSDTEDPKPELRKKNKKKIQLSETFMVPTNITSPERKEISKSRSMSSEHIVSPKIRLRSFSDPKSPPKLTRKSSVARVKIEKEYDSKYTVLRRFNLGKGMGNFVESSGKKKEDTVVYINPLLQKSAIPAVNVTAAKPKKKTEKKFVSVKKSSQYPRNSATYFANPLHDIVQDRDELKSQIYEKKEKKTKSTTTSMSSFYDGNQSLTDYSLVYSKNSITETWVDKDLPENLKEEQRKIMEENTKRQQEREARRKKREEELAKEMEDGLKEVEKRRREKEEKKKQLEKEAKEALEEAEKRKEERRKRLESIN